MQPGDVLLLENLRFHAGEETNDRHFADELAANRRPLRQRRLLRRPPRPRLDRRPGPPAAGLCRRARCGGSWTRWTRRWAIPSGRCWASSAAPRSRPSSTCCDNLVTKLDKLAIGGGMANTFLLRPGPRRRRLLLREGPGRHRPRDHPTWPARTTASSSCRSTSWSPRSWRPARRPACRGLGAIDDDERILDAGPETVERLMPRHGRLQDPDLERPAGRVRDAALRQGHRGGRPARRGLGQGGQAGGGGRRR